MKVLIATHGMMASGVVNTLSLFTDCNDIRYLNAYVDESDYTQQIVDFINQIDETETAIIFTDIIGGSVNQKVVAMNHRKNVKIITGFNLALILEIIMADATQDEQIEVIIEQAREQMKLIKLDLLQDSNDNEALFFE
ncbi:PTS fructose transporter subunit IIA [[Clostridium] innocuum]|nr:PTS fructose transporter subunit IIA [[Clostridium] innocuum]